MEIFLKTTLGSNMEGKVEAGEMNRVCGSFVAGQYEDKSVANYLIVRKGLLQGLFTFFDRLCIQRSSGNPRASD